MKYDDTEANELWMAKKVGRLYRCIVAQYPPSGWGVGLCVAFDMRGAASGWYTLAFDNGETVLLTGDEIERVELDKRAIDG